MPDPESQDERFMRRAMELAARGRGAVEPNPMVGCVIVRDGRVIGEGFHRKFGEAHAEPTALAACVESPRGSTAYLTLEPCCHVGKKTPPCVPRLIDAGVARVVVGCLDPNPKVSGKGVEQLREAGIEVTVGVLEAEAKQLIAAFFALVKYGRPYVTLKWAESADGKVGGPPGERLWISNRASQQVVHQLRARCDAILVGINTVLCDDPMLTVRGVEAMRPLLRVVLDRELKIPDRSRLVETARESGLLVMCSEGAATTSRADELRARGVEVVTVGMDAGGRIDLDLVVKYLGKRTITHLLVEPGPELARGFMEHGFVDRVWVFRSGDPVQESGYRDAVKVEYPVAAETMLAGDRLIEYLNADSEVFFAMLESIDFRLAASGGHLGQGLE
jgi:diaminohydroxyphosphoribosylaminopyrimidine deaminase/5-amino-6-(5-phosphoribosylamino)uracil reductase